MNALIHVQYQYKYEVFQICVYVTHNAINNQVILIQRKLNEQKGNREINTLVHL